MKFAHIGYGSMGKAIAIQALNRNHENVAILKPSDVISANNLQNSDIAVECTVPAACIKNIKTLCALKQDILIVTTGWYESLNELKDLVQKSNNRVMWSANYSIGVNIYLRIIEIAAKLINKAGEYDIWGTEIHHKNKIDSPSGTTKTLEKILLQNIDRKTSVVEEVLQRKIQDNEIHFSSTRGGLVNFAHTIGLDSEADCIELKHFARSRDGYAIGAIKCAEWLKKQKPGLYEMEDYLMDVLR